MTNDPYEVVVTAPAARAIQETLPEPVASAVIEFVTGPLVENPRRVGAPLRGELQGIWSGTYRILNRINEETREIVVLRIGHRRHIYRSG